MTHKKVCCEIRDIMGNKDVNIFVLTEFIYGLNVIEMKQGVNRAIKQPKNIANLPHKNHFFYFTNGSDCLFII